MTYDTIERTTTLQDGEIIAASAMHHRIEVEGTAGNGTATTEDLYTMCRGTVRGLRLETEDLTIIMHD